MIVRLALLLVVAVIGLLPVRAQEEPEPPRDAQARAADEVEARGAADGPEAEVERRRGKKAEEAFAVFVLAPWIVALVTFPVGLAAHCLILAHAPRRGLSLVHRVEAHRWKTLFLGGVNSLFLLVVFAATAQRAQPIAALAVFLWWALAFVGCHGIARAIGARVLGHEPGVHPGAPGDLKALALGWFVIAFASALPGIGWLLGTYWCVRGTGGVILAVFSVPEPQELAPPPSPA